ncbi:helix-turn-helix transcriptional regulator [Peribacillus sp. NPDC096540]|uniref:helix-turn-helix transcriptional regulator n=1 Tax=Peribacillus sp. NPDC096540 TaxID=3390612 RepID=UPI003D069957
MASPLSTREKLLHFIKREQQVTVGQIAKHLQITEMAVRKHLNILQRDSFIEVNEMKQPMGRPIQVFSLSGKGETLFPKNYETLTIDLINDLLALQGNEIINTLFEMRSDRLTKNYSLLMENIENEEKVEILTELQNQKGYMSESSKIDDHHFEIIEYNCPILEVSKNYKIACRCETEMFKEVLSADTVKRTTCKADGGNHCRFQILFNPLTEGRKEQLSNT